MPTAPPLPTGMIAAFALTRPSREFSVETGGRDCPLGQMVKYPSISPCGTTVTFNEYACAVDGIPHALAGMTKSRLLPPSIAGPPKGPAGLRVSATRQGVTGTNRSGCARSEEHTSEFQSPTN